MKAAFRPAQLAARFGASLLLLGCSNSATEPHGVNSSSSLSASTSAPQDEVASPEASTGQGNPLPSGGTTNEVPPVTPPPSSNPLAPAGNGSATATTTNSDGTSNGGAPGSEAGNAGAESSGGSASESAGGGGTDQGGAGNSATASGSNSNGGAGGGIAGDGTGSTGQGGVGGTTAQPAACPKPAPAICHEFLVGDNARNELQYVNEFDPAKNWTESVSATTANSPRQIALVSNAEASLGQAILVSVDNGYQEYDMVTGERLVEVVLAGTTGVHGAVRLPDGDTAVSLGDDQLRVVSPAGETVRQCTLPGAGADMLRVINRDESGNIYFGRLLDLFGVDDSCQTQWNGTLPTGGKAYSVVPSTGGGAWVSSGELCRVFEFDAQGGILSSVGGKDVHPNIGLDFFSGFQRLANGNVIAANWLGHLTPAETTPHLVEFTPENELIWTWGNQTLARQISNVLVLR